MSHVSLSDAVTLAYDALMASGHRAIADTLTDAAETTIPLVEWVDSNEGLLIQALHHIAETNTKNAAEIDMPAVKGLLTEAAASWRGHATKLSALVEALPREGDDE
jgi:hypothetical protein